MSTLNTLCEETLEKTLAEYTIQLVGINKSHHVIHPAITFDVPELLPLEKGCLPLTENCNLTQANMTPSSL